MRSSEVAELVPNEIRSPAEQNAIIARPASHRSRGSEIIYCDVHYSVPVKVKGQAVEKHILKGVRFKKCSFFFSGIMRPGLNAILGPSGSGKTTLLDVLAGRKDKRYLSGDVLVNGERQPIDFRLASGYVVQDDVVLGTLTVRENLYFSAALRLGSKFAHHDRISRVEMIIQDLGLTACADARVGTVEIRGISGGERKRTSIGMELITSPDVLFLDEPTTGLDATTACNVISLLQSQAQRGRTIVFSIHQPRYSIFKLFDKITLLSQGEVIYSGAADNSLSYFESLGYVCEIHNNPADFYLDIISDEMQRAIDVPATAGSLDGNLYATKKSLAASFREHHYYVDIQREISPTLEGLYKREEVGEIKVQQSQIGYQCGFLTQLWYLCVRASKHLVRDPRSCTVQLITMVLYGIIVGVIYYRLKRDSNGIQNRAGVLFFIGMIAFFSNLSVVDIFIKERPLFKHEMANGFYRVSTFFLAKVICDLIAMRICQFLIFTALSYFMVGFVEDVSKFWTFYLTLLLTAIASSSLCLLVSSSISVFAVANLVISITMGVMTIFSGLLVNLHSIPVWFRWFPHISIYKYCLVSLEIIELENLTFGSDCGPYHNSSCPTGNDYLSEQGFAPDQLWTNLIILPAMSAGYLLLAYIQLRRMKKYK